MSVQYVDQLFQTGVKTSVDDKGWITATAQRRLNVFVSSPDDNESAVLLSPLVPREKTAHPLFTGLRCTGVSVDRRGPLHFEVSADYASSPYKESQQGPQSPLNQPTQVNYFTVTSQDAIDEDRDGKPIVTACGEPFAGVTKSISDLGIRLQKNFATFDPASFYTFIDCVNSDTFIGFPPGTLRIVNISSDEQFFTDENGNSLPFWSVQVEIHARKPYRTTTQRAWWLRVRHEGFMVRPAGGGEPVRGVDGNKADAVQPIQLDEQGYKLANQEDATWREFALYDDVQFAAMGF
jgi:hypothetical protein